MPVTMILVVPCYNEELRLPVGEFRDFLRSPGEVGILFVNDGSKDATGGLLDDLKREFPAVVRTLHLERNVGKAEAVRRGVLEAVQSPAVMQVGYFDADLATPLSEAARLLNVARTKNVAMTFGSRVKRLGIRLDRSGLRHYVGRMFATEASLLLGLPVYDTQCGAKLFSAELARKIFREQFLSRWFFDVEIFFRLIEIYGRDRVEREVLEVPLDSWVEKGATKVLWTDFLKAPFELLRIYRFYRSRVR
ncbi:MAG: glycosyltransferase family 2 protein [Candidatus Omnitrophica bacterium]|nr:glycosyltransferase family 2 protein [Candidatus Omnitrophota bacterium]